MVDQTARLIELAVEHRFLSRESADKLVSESLKLSMPPDALALKAGVLQPWQIEALRMLRDPENIVPGYRLKSLLGRGGFGSVFRATQTNMSRDVALKTIPLHAVKDSSAARRFEREAKIVGQLRHPHIVAAYDFGFHNDRLFLSLELVDGKDLGLVLKRVHQFDEFTAWHIIRQTVTALAYAEELGVTHRDIKPANLLVTTPPIGYSLPNCVPFVKVADFGLACFAETRRDEGITLENSGLGTPSYVAPEQLRGGDVDVRADIYSLGATTYRLLSGVAPYASMAPMKVAKEKLAGDEKWLKDLSEFSKPTATLIRKMSAFDVSSRVVGHQALLQEVDRVIAGLNDQLDHSTQAFQLAEDERVSTVPELTDTGNFGVVSDTKSSGDFDVDSALVSAPSEVAKKAIPKPVMVSLTGLVLLFSIAAGVYFFPSRAGQPPSGPTFQPDWTTTVRSFDGLKLDYSKFKLRKGTWAVDLDEEGGRVLKGTHCKVVFPASDNDGIPFDWFRFSIGVRPSQEMDLSISLQLSGEQQPEFEVVATPAGIQTRFPASDSSFDSDVVPWPASEESGAGYFRIIVERHPNFYRITRDSDAVSKIAPITVGPVELALQVNGSAVFESPEICRLIEPPPTADP